MRHSGKASSLRASAPRAGNRGDHRVRRRSIPSIAAPHPPPSAAFRPPQFETPPPAPHGREFVGKHEDAERYHPEAEHRQKPEHTEEDERHPDDDAQPARARHGELAPHHRNPARLCPTIPHPMIVGPTIIAVAGPFVVGHRISGVGSRPGFSAWFLGLAPQHAALSGTYETQARERPDRGQQIPENAELTLCKGKDCCYEAATLREQAFPR